MENVILLGAGGHCRSVIAALNTQRYRIAGIYDRSASGSLAGYPIIGNDDDIPAASPDSHLAFITVGMLTSAAIRIRLARLLANKGYQLINVIDKTAIVSCPELGTGNFIGKGCILNEVQSIGDNNIINTGAIIDHGTVVGSFNHIAPGTTICGEVRIGDECLIGAGATVIQQRVINSGTIVPAGTTVR